ncbi:MAG: cytochrome P450 [Microcella sp.]|uniref:cytochrome P450 n=1 Tax=Microcella sp. TaxID=1913979 RepID=UPI00271EA133|nr:cytochrome P450 [Microcella sp.]MDO8336971.1 cytochrome P450 [Microcella sp.]
MSTTTALTLADLDLFAHGAPWDVFEELRRTPGLHHSTEEAPNSGFWSVTRYHEIVRVLRDTETFTSTRFTNLEEVDPELQDQRRSLLEMDGVRHRALRRMLQGEFTPQAVAKYETFLRGITAKTVDAALAKKEFDFVDEVSADFPIRVLARLLGVPDSDTGQLIAWGNRMVGNTDPEHADVLIGSADSDEYRHVPFRSPAAIEVYEYGRHLAAERRGKGGTDLVTLLADGVPGDGVPLSEHEFNTNFLLLIVAGNETTRHTITHSMSNLLNNPEQMALLKNDPSLIPWAVEEFLRYASPVYHFRRTATKDVEFSDTQISEGEKVVVWFASGNRDDTAFEDPYRFDVTRNPNEHMSFGRGGPHMCLGNALARIELRIMFEELLSRDVVLERTGDIDYLRSNFVHGIKRMPVRVV